MTREYICLKEDEGNQLSPRTDLNISTLTKQIFQPIEINLKDLLESIKYPTLKISATINKFDTIDNFRENSLVTELLHEYDMFKMPGIDNINIDTIDNHRENYVDTELLNQLSFKTEELIKPLDKIFPELFIPEFEFTRSCMVLTKDGWVQGCF